MSRKCQITGKKRTSGHTVSHSKVQTKRSVYPNLQNKKMINPATGRVIKVKLTAAALKTFAKWQREGKTYDLAKMMKKKF